MRMTLERNEKYEIVYRVGGEEETAIVRYRGLGTATELARGEGSSTASNEDANRHWFQVDGAAGFVVVDPEDLVSFEPAD